MKIIEIGKAIPPIPEHQNEFCVLAGLEGLFVEEVNECQPPSTRCRYRKKRTYTAFFEEVAMAKEQLKKKTYRDGATISEYVLISLMIADGIWRPILTTEFIVNFLELVPIKSKKFHILHLVTMNGYSQ